MTPDLYVGIGETSEANLVLHLPDTNQRITLDELVRSGKLEAQLLKWHRFNPPEPDLVAYFFGVRPGHRSGHHCYVPGYHPAPRAKVGPWSPWGNYRDPLTEWPALSACWRYDGSRVQEPQTEGEPRYARKDGWTLMTLWDRSADKRGGCCALFAFDQLLSDGGAQGLARQLFPEVFGRIETHLGRPVTWPGEKVPCPSCRRPLPSPES